MLNNDIINQRLELKREIEKKGYEDLRYSLLLTEKENRAEWQWRIDFEDNKYFVYGLADRASILGRKLAFSDFKIAKVEFLDRLGYMLERNIKKVSNGEKPDYPSLLWDKS